MSAPLLKEICNGWTVSHNTGISLTGKLKYLFIYLFVNKISKWEISIYRKFWLSKGSSEPDVNVSPSCWTTVQQGSKNLSLLCRVAQFQQVVTVEAQTKMESLHKTFHCGFLGASPGHTREPGWLLDRTSGICSFIFLLKQRNGALLPDSSCSLFHPRALISSMNKEQHWTVGDFFVNWLLWYWLCFF